MVNITNPIELLSLVTLKKPARCQRSRNADYCWSHQLLARRWQSWLKPARFPLRNHRCHHHSNWMRHIPLFQRAQCREQVGVEIWTKPETNWRVGQHSVYACQKWQVRRRLLRKTDNALIHLSQCPAVKIRARYGVNSSMWFRKTKMILNRAMSGPLCLLVPLHYIPFNPTTNQNEPISQSVRLSCQYIKKSQQLLMESRKLWDGCKYRFIPTKFQACPQHHKSPESPLVLFIQLPTTIAQTHLLKVN